MPIIIPQELPAHDILHKENIFVMSEKRAYTQDIRPIEVAILNLMPTKVDTETQLMRLLGNTPLQVNVTLVSTSTYKSKNTSENHLDKFYVSFDDIKNRAFDGMIITGAPVENMQFEDVAYWEELKQIMDYADKNVTSTIYICWGAQAALYYYYGINKRQLSEKCFGIFRNQATRQFDPLLKGLNDYFNIPHSRHTEIVAQEVYNRKDIQVLAKGDDCGISIIKSNDNSKFFFLGHSEYDRDTLKKEYIRDKLKGLNIAPPSNYFTDMETLSVKMTWATTANLLFYNWLNYYVYQVTPYNMDDIVGK